MFEEEVGGKETDYIKLREVAQTNDGKNYAIVYNNDGIFYLRTFGKQNRSHSEIKELEVNLNDLCDLDNFTICIESLYEPNINCCFIDYDTIFISLFYNHFKKKIHYHFIYSLVEKKNVGNIVSVNMNCSALNYPIKSFYEPVNNEVYQFYRSGHSFIINLDDSDLSDFIY
jgi:hypothetical protein